MNKRPHIVIFNPDQFRGDALGHMGNPAAVTPNLIKWLKGRVSFRNAFAKTRLHSSRCSL